MPLIIIHHIQLLYIFKNFVQREKTNDKSEYTGIQENYGLTNGGYYYPNIGYYLKLDSLTMTKDCVN